MTHTRVFSACFVSLLILGCTVVVCLVDERVTAAPASTIDAIGGSTLPFVCGTNSPKCVDYCHLCYDFYEQPTMECLSQLVEVLCLFNFEAAMESLNSTDWCVWGNVNSLYSNVSFCTEEISDCLLIPWPNPLVEQIFVDIHSKFFKDCPTEELSDPPPAIIFALVITPICLIPVMVSLVVLKTKNGDGSS
ncbi:receptor activity-modifying protein 2 isoform X2 [Parambassis ranga]|uniref:Receptor activity-modifying protein 2 isoform X2 n=1 Tax=Parambassis ranga TaxID=210632 RepID=A0A6P7IX55_9TELE|nr:receptor activity-modifying protein 2 isoform X2 [Parambassis ranga]